MKCTNLKSTFSEVWKVHNTCVTPNPPGCGMLPSPQNIPSGTFLVTLGTYRPPEATTVLTDPHCASVSLLLALWKLWHSSQPCCWGTWRPGPSFLWEVRIGADGLSGCIQIWDLGLFIEPLDARAFLGAALCLPASASQFLFLLAWLCPRTAGYPVGVPCW